MLNTELFTDEAIKASIKKAVAMLQNAPFQGSEYICIYAYQSGSLENIVMGGTSYLQGAEMLVRFPFVFPDYNSELYMKEVGIEYTDENRREWDWNNFRESGDFDNKVEELIFSVKERLNDLTQN